MCPTETELIRLVGGELSPPQADELRTHVAHCPKCTRALAAVQSTWDVLGQWQVDAPQRDLAGAVLRAASRPRALPWPRIAAAILAAAGAGLLAGRTAPLTEPAPHAVSDEQLVEHLGLDALADPSVSLTQLVLELDEREPS
jgi:anti-sigma factor RsiW